MKRREGENFQKGRTSPDGERKEGTIAARERPGCREEEEKELSSIIFQEGKGRPEKASNRDVDLPLPGERKKPLKLKSPRTDMPDQVTGTERGENR